MLFFPRPHDREAWVWLAKCCKIQQLGHLHSTTYFMSNEIYLYPTFYICIRQYAFSFNFNQNYLHSTKIFLQLQPKLLHSTKIFVQLQSKIRSFKKIFLRIQLKQLQLTEDDRIVDEFRAPLNARR